jgi:hypothetical protein
VNANEFRKMALALLETEKHSHMNHTDFRSAGRIFATIGYPDKTRGMVKLSPEDQHYFSRDYPGMFTPVKGLWDAAAPLASASSLRRERLYKKRSSRVAQHRTQAPPGVGRRTGVWQGFHSSWQIGARRTQCCNGKILIFNQLALW